MNGTNKIVMETFDKTVENVEKPLDKMLPGGGYDIGKAGFIKYFLPAKKIVRLILMSNISRRDFIKGAGAAALAVAAAGVLAGCSKDDIEEIVTKDVKVLFMCNGAVVPGDQQTIKVAQDAETVALSEIPASYYPFGYKVTSTGDLKIRSIQGADVVLVMVEELEVEVTVHFYDKDTKEDVKIASFWCGAATKSISKEKADELAGDWCTIDADEKAPFTINWQDCTIRIAAKKN